MSEKRDAARVSVEIEDLVDEAVRHPERAARIKESLKRRVLGAAPTRPAGPDRGRSQASIEDLWDNLPV